jgi:DnaK suppressor protein
MDTDTARARLNEEKQQLQALTGEAEDDAVAEGLRLRLASVERALARLDDGTYGRSVRSGAEIPDARLDADPAADLTADEALEE